ncbi:hypothetical protein BBX50_12410 [Ensifer sp. LC11]|nr:hypothetical protein BBX50_12410 [Ensifer sp. LC11]
MALAVPVDGATSAACAGSAGHSARAAAIAGAPIAATLCAVASAAPDVFATLVAAACAIFTIPASGIGVVRMGGGNPGKARGKTSAVAEAWQISGECRKASYRQGRQSQQACPQVSLLVQTASSCKTFCAAEDGRLSRVSFADSDFCVSFAYRSIDAWTSYSGAGRGFRGWVRMLGSSPSMTEGEATGDSLRSNCR